MKPRTPQEEGTLPQTHRLRVTQMVHYSQLSISESWEQMLFLSMKQF